MLCALRGVRDRLRGDAVVIRYGSVCSGIEAATVAWHPLGWRPAFFAEIEPFPSAVLAHHYPAVANLGDITRFKEWPDADIDVLVGGTPCQSFSIAGLRQGLADPRGNLALTYLAVTQRYRPRWLVWENVPGMLSVHDGSAFAAFLHGLGELGYGWAYRVLDAQYFGVPQRRRRVFVVGSARGWAAGAAVLFERESLSGHPAPSRAAREGVARPIGAGSLGGSGYRNDADTAENLIASGITARYGKGCDSDVTDTVITHALRAEGFDASEDGTGRGTPLVPVAAPLSAGSSPNNNAAGRRREDDINLVVGTLQASGKAAGSATQQDAESGMLIAFDTTQITHPENRSRPDDRSPQLAASAHAPTIAFYPTNRQPEFGNYDDVSPAVKVGSNSGGNPPAVAMNLRGRDGGAMPETADVASLRAASGGSSRSFVAQTAVRRLTPRECERLQGFPDDFTLIPYKGAPAKDAPRYKALGNSMAVPVMRWIGERIALVESVISEMEAA